MNNQMENFLIDFMKSLQVPVHHRKIPCEEWQWWDLGLRSDILKRSNTPEKCNEWVQQLEEKTIYFLDDEFLCSYTIFRESEESFFFIGPVLFDDVNEDQILKIEKQFSLSKELTEELKIFYQKVCRFASRLAYENIFMLLGKYLWGEGAFRTVYLEAEDLNVWEETYQNYAKIKTSSACAYSVVDDIYRLEDEMLLAVSEGREGNAVKALESWQALKIPNSFYLSLERLKEENITLNALFRKAANQVGIQPIHLESYSERNMQLIRQMDDVEKCIKLQRRLIAGYCRLVKNLTHKNYSQITQKVVAYIDTDIGADLRLKTLADLHGITPNYLSMLFHTEVGIPLTEYVNNSRIRHAKRLLLTTGDSVKKVAQASGFSDVYYFCRLFKRECGMTPTQFRKDVGYKDYLKLLSLQSVLIKENELNK